MTDLERQQHAAKRLAEEERRLVPAADGLPARLASMPDGDVELWTRLWNAVIDAAKQPGALSRRAATQVTMGFHWAVRLKQALKHGLLTAEEVAFLREHYEAAKRVQRTLVRLRQVAGRWYLNLKGQDIDMLGLHDYGQQSPSPAGGGVLATVLGVVTGLLAGVALTPTVRSMLESQPGGDRCPHGRERSFLGLACPECSRSPHR